jgi:hypothetical protein
MPVQKDGPVTFRLRIANSVIAETTFQVVNSAKSEAIQSLPQAAKE